MFSHLVFIGRFQPFHLGHLSVVKEAFAHTDHLIMLIGSSNRASSLKNPFSYEQRRQMIEEAVHQNIDMTGKTLSCVGVPDAIYNDNLWLSYVQKAVASVTKDEGNIGVIGHTKDDSSYYLKLFPAWGFCEVPNFHGLSATPIRHSYFAGKIETTLVPETVANALQDFMTSSGYARLAKEALYIKQYQASFATLPHPPIFQTVDALVVAGGHVLVVCRGGDYGKGLLALAGGFVGVKETRRQAMVRELQEETGLCLEGVTPKAVKVFDAPDRSERARTITTVYHYALDGLVPLTAGDDAADAFWLPLSQLNASEFFEDHYGIIGNMLGVYESGQI